MSHLDPDQLGLHALGESVLSDGEADHLRSCAECAAELASLKSVADLAGGNPEIDVVTPPESVWAAIDRETGEPGSAADSEVGRHAASTPAGSEPATTRRQRTSPLWLAAAAIAGVLLGVGAVTAWQGFDSDDGDEGGQTVAVVDLTQPDAEETPALGSARLVEADGQRALSVTLDDAEPESGFLQVWLLAPDASSLLSIGVLEGTTGTFDLPAGLDIDEFPVVDVSVEPFDGDPGHSGDSIARGEIEAPR